MTVFVRIYALVGGLAISASIWLPDYHIKRMNEGLGLPYEHSFPLLQAVFWLAVFTLEIAVVNVLVSAERSKGARGPFYCSTFLGSVGLALAIFGFTHPAPPRAVHELVLLVGAIAFGSLSAYQWLRGALTRKPS